MTNMIKKEIIGYCAVDSGQILLTDPCYLKDWINDEFQDIRRYKDRDGKIHQFRVDFENYESKIGDKTVNQLINNKEWERIENVKSSDYSYNGACSMTLSKKGGGELEFHTGFSSAGVVISTAHGDGVYPVSVKRDKDGKILSATIDFS